jgi:hypothetical protein
LFPEEKEGISTLIKQDLIKLESFPPFIPQILKRESSEWLIQQIHENLKEEYKQEGLNEEEM